METVEELKARVKYLERQVDRLEEELDGSFYDECENCESEVDDLVKHYRPYIIKFIEVLKEAKPKHSMDPSRKVVEAWDDEVHSIQDFLEDVIKVS